MGVGFSRGGSAGAGHGPEMAVRRAAGDGSAGGEAPQGPAVAGGGIVDDEEVGEAAARAGGEISNCDGGTRTGLRCTACPAAVTGEKALATTAAKRALEAAFSIFIPLASSSGPTLCYCLLLKASFLPSSITKVPAEE